MFKFLTKLVRSVPRSDGSSTNRGPDLRERPDRGSTRPVGERFRLSLEALEERATPGGGDWSG